jgi:TolB-like protein/Flp pilus assembly protein TadD
MLRFLVEETLAGRSDRLKEYVVGLEVFDRPDSYDPRLDSIVRVEARRLRAALNQYYANEGNADPIIIELPKGSYVTNFRFRHQVPSPDPRPSRVPFSRGTIWTAVAVGLLLGLAAVFLFWHTPRNRANLPHNATIAVLQFDNLSNVAENEYFCFALTDEITTQLAKAGDLRVVARTSAARFKRGDDIADIARQLRVDVVLEGSVRLSEGRLLVSAQLIDAADRIHIWSEMYERPGADQIRAQDEIAQAVARAVRRQLAGNGGKTPPQVRYSPDADANLLYWRGIYLRTPMGNTNWRSDLLKSADYLERAVQRDNSFARAYAALADVYVSLAWERGGGPITREFMVRGERAARRAIELDSTLAEGHSALGTIQFFYNHDPAASEKSFERALQSNPSNGKARMWYAYALVMQRRFDRALAQARQAEELDPLSYVSTTHLAVVNYFSRRYTDALKLVSETMDVAQSAPAHGLRGMILETQGKYDEAIAEYQAGLRLVPTHSYIKGMLGHAYAMSGRTAEAKQLLKDANLEFEKGGLSDLKAAYIYLALGDRDQALRHLELDYEQGDPELPYINVDPVFDPVRNDPRFLAILKTLGLADQAGPNMQ